jgi:hypothetical protein
VSDPNIEVLLTDESEFHCFKLVFRARPQYGGKELPPIQIYLHTTQAIDLFTKLAVQLSAYMNQASAELIEIKTRT